MADGRVTCPSGSQSPPGPTRRSSPRGRRPLTHGWKASPPALPLPSLPATFFLPQDPLAFPQNDRSGYSVLGRASDSKRQGPRMGCCPWAVQLIVPGLLKLQMCVFIAKYTGAQKRRLTHIYIFSTSFGHQVLLNLLSRSIVSPVRARDKVRPSPWQAGLREAPVPSRSHPQQSEVKCFAPDHQSFLLKTLRETWTSKPCAAHLHLQLHCPPDPARLPASCRYRLALPALPKSLNSSVKPHVTVTPSSALASWGGEGLHIHDAQNIHGTSNLEYPLCAGPCTM